MYTFISEYDIFEYNQEGKLIINYLNGAFDFITDEMAQKIIKNDIKNLNLEEINILKERGYLFNSIKEKEDYLENLYSYLKNKEDKTVPNFLFIPTYNCNFKCSYCYQETYSINTELTYKIKESFEYFIKAIEEIILSFKKKNNISFSNQEVNITLMGGEPLLKENFEAIEYILMKLYEKKFSITIITNGYDIDYFNEIFDNKFIRAVQITIDGNKEIHDKRRVLKNNEGTYTKIIENINLLLKNKIKVYLRVNVDSSNISYLEMLSEEIKNKIKDPYKKLTPYLYLIQDGGCSGTKFIIDEIQYLKEILKIKSKLNKFKFKFHGDSFFEAIQNNKKIPFKTKNCSACSNQFIFDYLGNIYKCWFGVGNEKFIVGKYGEKLELNQEVINLWKNRDIFFLTKCSKCKYKFICGGGCLSHILENSVDIDKEKCNNYKEIFQYLINNLHS